MTCQCGKEISSPKLTGELCAFCFFKTRNPTINEVREIKGIITDIIEPDLAENIGYSADNHISIDEPIPTIEKEIPPTVSKNTETKQAGLKYCQSCIERGYGLKLATREWRADYFICDECFGPLLNNLVGIGDEDIRKIKESNGSIDPTKPFLNQAFDLLSIPTHLRFYKSDEVLNKRNDIFNYHATAVINKSIPEVANRIEELAVLLFQIKIEQESNQNYINLIKSQEREKAGLKGLEKSEKEYTKSPSKLKISKDEKMAKQLGMTLEKYMEMVKSAKKTEFDKIVNS